MRNKQREKPAPSSAAQEHTDPFNQTQKGGAQEDESLLEGMASLNTQISRAKTSGKLVISGRSLTSFPESVCNNLLPRNSPFHPGNKKQSSSSGKAPAVVLDMDSHAGDKWYEERPLTALLANANEFQELPEAIGGFEELATLDLRSNLLTVSALPNSLMSLVSLTSLTLANNKLDKMPFQLLALDSLISLDLSGNSITQLWTAVTWKDQLEDLQRECREAQRDDQPGPDDTFSTESEVSTDFWSTFPSSPAIKSKGVSDSPFIQSDAPFPRLKTLNLSSNQLTHSTLSSTVLPASLAHLDLSRNPLGSSSALALDQPPFDQLSNLQTLNLSSCDLEAVSSTSFPRMRELDLSGNMLDVLNDLPRMLGQEGKRSVKLTGLPRALESMNKELAQVGEQEQVVVRLAGNALGQEIVRWRSRKRGGGVRDTPTSSRVLRSQTKPAASTSAVTPNDTEELAKRVSDLAMSNEIGASAAHSQHAASPASTAPVETFHFADGYDSETLLLTLAGQKMSEFPIPSGSSEAPPVASLDLSRNQLPILPFDTLASYGWVASLTRLDISRNRLSSVQGSAATFGRLETLHLASNMLSDPLLLVNFSKTCPALVHLDLSTNFLSSLEGVDALLLRPGGGLKSLKLGGNRLSDLTALASVAERIRDGAQGWRCTTLELNDNDINKLPPQLGYLPLDVLSVSGNTFRIPQYRVWESGGTKGLLKWLQDRAG